MPTNSELFPQYSPGIADQSYQFDFCTRVTLTSGQHTTLSFPVQANIVRIRQVIVEDVTVATGGTAPSTGIACYFRFDGVTASAGLDAATNMAPRVVKSGSATFAYPKPVNRFIAAENGINLYNPNAGTVVIQVELGA
jgi:hypothetical protein